MTGKTVGRQLVICMLACALVSCSSLPTDQEPVEGETASQSSNATTDANESSTKGIAFPEGSTASKEAGKMELIKGSGVFHNKRSSRMAPVSRAKEGGINLQFINTDISTLLDAVLVDTLGVAYQLDPNVKGNVSLETSEPVSEQGLLYILEMVLKTKNAALVKTADGYHVLPISEAPRHTPLKSRLPASKNLPGFTMQIVPLRYTTPSEMRKVLEPFAPRGGILASDDARNILILAGTGQEVASMLEVVDTFDVNWLAGMSFAMFELQYVESEALAKELLQIFGDAESPIAGVVRFIPIPRLNRLLVVSPQVGYLEEVKSWIKRLDLGGSAPGRRIYVYHVQNGRASDLAQSLNAILGGENSGGGNPFYSRSTAESGTNRSSLSPTQGGALNSTGARNNTRTPTNGSRLSGPVNNQRSSGVAGADRSSVTALGTESIRIVPSEENNSLLILAAPSEYGVIEAALKQMDEAPRQVLIEATLAEVTLTDELRYGVQWFFESGGNQGTLSETTNGATASAFPGFSYVYSGSSDVRAVLNALESVTDVNVVSSPKLLILNNQPATLQVGDEVPVPRQSAVSTSDSNAPIVNSVDYRDTGVILTVTARINAGGLVYLDVVQEVSDVAETTSSGIDAPTIQQRRIESSVAVQDGETIALGGLIRETDTVTKAGVPVLQHIPVLGNVFRRNSLTNRRTELIILITPRVITDVQETRDVLDYLKKTFRNVEKAWEAE